MIEIYEGRLGGGKTYSAVVRMVDHVRRGGFVCTNVEIKWDAIRAFCAERYGVEVEDDQVLKLSDEQIGLFHKHTPSGTPELPVLVVLDEAHLNFNARDWSHTERELLSFLTQSRKVATDIIFISQSAENIDKQFRRLVQFVWRFRDLTKWRIPALGIGWPFNQILACQYDYDGKTQIDRKFVMKDRAIFALYNTNSLLREFPRLEGCKTKRDLKQVERKKPMMKFVIPIVLAIGAVCAWQAGKSFMKKDAPSAQVAQSSAVPVRPVVTPRPWPFDHETAQIHSREVNEKQYEIYEERFRSYSGFDHVMTTDAGWYKLGEMSNKGLVKALSPQIAQIAQPDGRTGWVVSREMSAQEWKEVMKDAPKAEPTPTPPTPPTPQPDKQSVTYGQRLHDSETPKPMTPRPRGLRSQPRMQDNDTNQRLGVR